MGPTNRDDELVADPSSECARLCEGEMVRIRRDPAAHQTWLPIASFDPNQRCDLLARLVEHAGRR